MHRLKWLLGRLERYAEAHKGCLVCQTLSSPAWKQKGRVLDYAVYLEQMLSLIKECWHVNSGPWNPHLRVGKNPESAERKDPNQNLQSSETERSVLASPKKSAAQNKGRNRVELREMQTQEAQNRKIHRASRDINELFALPAHLRQCREAGS